MLDVLYAHALDMSKEQSEVKYVLFNSLHIVYVYDKSELLAFLKDGYNILACFNNGVEESTWNVTDTPVVPGICKILKHDILSKKPTSVIVNEQKFYDDDYELNCRYMYIDIFYSDGTSETFHVTEKNTQSPLFPEGQRKAEDIHGYIMHFNIKQDKESIIKLLERQGY